MAKWQSVLFSDIRNKLGSQVVFASWKGRGYFRTYVKPANPRTNKQQASRDVMRKLVAKWKELSGDPDVKALWNNLALPYQISGYNLFTKYGRKSKISCPATASGAGSVTVTVTYTLGLGASEAKIFMHRLDDDTWTDVTPQDGLSPDPNSTIDVTITQSGTYEFWIAHKDVLKAGDTAPQPYQVITKWTPDEANGVAKEAKCVVTIS